MFFSVSNDGFEWYLDCGPNSVTLTVKDLVQVVKINSQESPLIAWSLLLSHRQQFLNNHLARVPVDPYQQGTHEMKEVLSSVGAQDMHTSGYQVSSADLDDVDFFWEIDQLNVDAFLDWALILPFHQQRLTTCRWEVQQKTPFCSTKWKTRKTILLPQQHQSLRDHHDPLHCWEVVHLEQEMKMFLIMLIEICFNRYYRVFVLI